MSRAAFDTQSKNLQKWNLLAISDLIAILRILSENTKRIQSQVNMFCFQTNIPKWSCNHRIYSFFVFKSQGNQAIVKEPSACLPPLSTSRIWIRYHVQDVFLKTNVWLITDFRQELHSAVSGFWGIIMFLEGQGHWRLFNPSYCFLSCRKCECYLYIPDVPEKRSLANRVLTL